MEDNLKKFVNDYQMCFTINQRKYLGNKTSLINDFIDKAIREHVDKGYFEDGKEIVLLDLFAGTGTVANFARSEYDFKIVINDYLYHNYLSYLTFFGIKKKEHYLQIIELINELNEIKGVKGYCTENWSGKYFSSENCMKIDAIRDKIEEFKDVPFEVKASLITSLLYAIDKIANIAGIYTKWISSEDPTTKPIKLKIPIIDYDNNNIRNHIIKNDLAEELIDSNQLNFNILYIDPPYFSRSYYEFYHVLENIARWEKPKLFFSSLREKWSERCRTSFKSISSTEKNFEKIITKATDKKGCKMVIMSYSNHGVMSPNSIKEILGVFGNTTIRKREHIKYNNGRGNYKKDYKELLYISTY